MEQKAIVSCFVKNVAFLLGRPLLVPTNQPTQTVRQLPFLVLCEVHVVNKGIKILTLI